VHGCFAKYIRIRTIQTLCFVEVQLEHSLRTVLEKVRTEVPGNIFTGVGIIVCDSLDSLPFFPMSDGSKINDVVDTVSRVLIKTPRIVRSRSLD
jgi:hypothetical protein